MKTFLIIAGLPSSIFEKVRTLSEKRFVPNGRLVKVPLPGRYSFDYAAKIIELTHRMVVSEPEDQQCSILLVYADYPDASTRSFVEAFFPFALPFPVKPFLPTDTGGQLFNTERNEYISYIEDECRRAITVSAVVRKHTNVQNLTPLLLPVLNFNSAHLTGMLMNIFWSLSSAPSPDEIIKRETARFFGSHPRVPEPSGSGRHCFSNSVLVFKSPGRDRHGFFRNGGANKHNNICLLNARSRLGGTFDYRFHYDCEAVRGRLASEYSNCHSDTTKLSRSTHVNISPNDYIS